MEETLLQETILEETRPEDTAEETLLEEMTGRDETGRDGRPEVARLEETDKRYGQPEKTAGRRDKRDKIAPIPKQNHTPTK